MESSSDIHHPTSPIYASLAHPNDTLPDIDNATFARRKRRRTSPHDQAILEDEYRRCIKPDKARRREICKLVQMGEKEVQVTISSFACPVLSFCHLFLHFGMNMPVVFQDACVHPNGASRF
jgi:hypothetical protein